MTPKPYLQRLRELVQERAAETGDLEGTIYLSIEGIKRIGDAAVDARQEALDAFHGRNAYDGGATKSDH